MNPPDIEIYPMMNCPDGSSTIHEGRDTEPDFWDVIVGYAGDDPLEESEDHPTYEAAYAAAEEMKTRYPGAQIEEIHV